MLCICGGGLGEEALDSLDGRHVDVAVDRRHDRTHKVDRHISELTDVSVDAPNGPRETSLLRMLRVEEVNIEIVHAIPAADVLHRRALTKRDDQKPTPVPAGEVR